MDTQEPALKALIRDRHLTYESFCREWDRVARGVDEHLVNRWPGRAQYYRWLRGELVNGHPYPDACRMLEAMFPGWSIESLFSPYTGSTPEPPSVSAGEIQQTSENSVSGKAGVPSHTIDLSGEWWASWQTFRDGTEKIATQKVESLQSGLLIRMATITHGLTAEEGGYHWSGELRLWDNEVLMGWYAANEGSIRAKGTLYFAIHPHGLQMAGRWVGLGYDDRIMTGWARQAAALAILLPSINHLPSLTSGGTAPLPGASPRRHATLCGAASGTVTRTSRRHPCPAEPVRRTRTGGGRAGSHSGCESALPPPSHQPRSSLLPGNGWHAARRPPCTIAPGNRVFLPGRPLSLAEGDGWPGPFSIVFS